MTRLGIADEIKAKGVVPPLGQRVGTLIAKGEAEIGVQQITELLLDLRHRLRRAAAAGAAGQHHLCDGDAGDRQERDAAARR